jgi:hypothetical protein
MADAKPKRHVWGIRNKQQEIELYVGKDAPYLEGDFIGSLPSTKFLGQLRATESRVAIGFEVLKVGKPVEVAITIKPRRGK